MTKPDIEQRTGEIIPIKLAIKAMRDSGYKNTAYALAELIDNAVQADASSVELFCVEEKELVLERERRRISAIAVLDNGHGMSGEVLCKALQFGNGTHLKDRSGIGRFGMGLPNASISQCRRVRVWTWQHGAKNALKSYLDLDEIEANDVKDVPAPKHDPLPPEWAERADSIGSSGTLVVWDRFDEHRLTWKTARTTLDHTEILVGRIYRKLMDRGEVSIRLCAIADGTQNIDRSAKINDPLYLTANSSTPAPFGLPRDVQVAALCRHLAQQLAGRDPAAARRAAPWPAEGCARRDPQGEQRRRAESKLTVRRRPRRRRA